MQYHSLVLITYVLALLCPLVCVGYLCAADPDVVIYRREADVNVTDNITENITDSSTDNSTGYCVLAVVCTNADADALCAQEVVLGSECDPLGFWTALLLLKWVYILVWLTRLPILFTSVMHVVGKEGKVTPPHKLVDVCSVVSQMASFAAFVITVGAFWGRSERDYFPTGFPFMLWYVMRLDYGLSLLLPLWFDNSFTCCQLAAAELQLTVLLSLIGSGLGTFVNCVYCSNMPYYMLFAVLNFLAPLVGVISYNFSRGLAELLTVCSFFVYTASYYALDVEDREDTTYFMYGHHQLLLMPAICLFWVALITTPVRDILPQKISKPITWEVVCEMPEQQAAAVILVLSAIGNEIAARNRKNGKDSRTPEALPQDTLHAAFHGATAGQMRRIVNYFFETGNGFAIIVASRVLIDRIDLLVDMDIPTSQKYRLLKACDDEALSTHVLDKIPIAELCNAINNVERNPDKALDYVARFGYIEKLIPECKAVPSWRYMLPFVGSAHTPTCALIARGYKGLLPKKRLYIATAVMWVCVYLAGLVFSIYACVSLGLENDTDGSMPLFLAFLIPAGVLVSHDVVSPPLRAVYALQTRRTANNPPTFVQVNEWSPDFTLSQPLNDSWVEKPQSAGDSADVAIQLEEVSVKSADDV